VCPASNGVTSKEGSVLYTDTKGVFLWIITAPKIDRKSKIEIVDDLGRGNLKGYKDQYFSYM
jgi:hypothetical protein